ncbi:MAG: trypsin-like peptidase domain-containing protein [Clostridia bacterium]|nr:trypsin-like peptidase domain-containing protein [Clostridia bacterium]
MKKRFKSCILGVALAVAMSFSACDVSTMMTTGGKSAYEIAVENGFQGTEQEWLLSLQGKNGQDGKNPTIEEFYTAWLEDGNEGTFSDFLKDYLQVTVSDNNDTETIQENVTSAVAVYCPFEIKSGLRTESKMYLGSGVIWELDKETGSGYIVTNYHVVYNGDAENKICQNIGVCLYGGILTYDSESGQFGSDTVKAEFVGGSLTYDIAVLKVEDSSVLKTREAKAVTIGNSDQMMLGEKVFTIGNPEGEGMGVTQGVVTTESQYVELAIDGKNTVDYRVLRTDAAINHGNSGGGLFNAKGELIGIVNSKNVDKEVENMGYALPINCVKEVIGNILDNGGKVLKARMGVTVQTTSGQSVYDQDTGKLKIVETVTVQSVEAGYPAFGKLQQGDIVTAVEIGGVKLAVERNFQVIDRMLALRLGDTMKITVLRNGVKREFTLVFDSKTYFTEVA